MSKDERSNPGGQKKETDHMHALLLSGCRLLLTANFKTLSDLAQPLGNVAKSPFNSGLFHEDHSKPPSDLLVFCILSDPVSQRVNIIDAIAFKILRLSCRPSQGNRPRDVDKIFRRA